MKTNKLGKVALFMLRRYDRYMAGEIAGFEPEIAKRLCAGDAPFAEVYDAKKHDEAARRKQQAAAASQVVDLDEREADLAAREAALAAREAELEAQGDGAPPAQGPAAKS
ncbi:MAG: hypothetical protein CSA72_10560 [Rhodobacterales bacterium]|nr:MAG: hypothetical protein CSA72_10560 [Rhodobacterales bacterium]